jgi:hypothetical protein
MNMSNRGSLWVDDVPTATSLVWPRQKGRWTLLSGALLAEADEAKCSIRLSVLQKSDAGRFHRRFGFLETAQDDFDIYPMRPYQASSSQAADPGEFNGLTRKPLILKRFR